MDSASPSALQLLVRDRIRLFNTLTTTPLRAELAPRLFYILCGEVLENANLVSATPSPLASWVGRTAHLMRQFRLDLGVVHVPSIFAQSAAAASVYARAAAFRTWQRTALERRLPTWSFYDRPPGGRPRDHISAWLNKEIPASALGQLPRSTPLSCVGISCSGNLQAIANRSIPRHRRRFLLAAAVGTRAFYHFPHAPKVWLGKRGESQAVFREMSHAARCHACAPLGHDSPLSDWHIICECLHPVLAGRRARIADQARGKIVELIMALYAARHAASERTANPTDPASDAIIRTATETARAVDFSSKEGKTLLYRLVTVRPWSQRDTEGGDTHSAAFHILDWLGALFDGTNVNHNHLRPLASMFCDWGHRAYSDLAGRWRDTVEASGASRNLPGDADRAATTAATAATRRGRRRVSLSMPSRHRARAAPGRARVTTHRAARIRRPAPLGPTASP